MRPITFNTTPSLVFELGATKRIGAIAAKMPGRSVLFVADPLLRKLGLCDAAVASPKAEGISLTVFDAVKADLSLPVNNPRAVSEADALVICKAAW